QVIATPSDIADADGKVLPDLLLYGEIRFHFIRSVRVILDHDRSRRCVELRTQILRCNAVGKSKRGSKVGNLDRCISWKDLNAPAEGSVTRGSPAENCRRQRNIEDPKSSADCRFAISLRIEGKTHAWSKIFVARSLKHRTAGVIVCCGQPVLDDR